MYVFCRFVLAILLCLICGHEAQARLLTGYAPVDGVSSSASVPLVQDYEDSVDVIDVAEPFYAPKPLDPVISGVVSPAPRAPQVQDSDNAPVDFQADQLDYDEANQLVLASGNVIIEQQGRILRADMVRHNLRNDTVFASGHVVLNELNGDIYYANEVELTDGMKNGVVTELTSQLADGARFTADRGVRSGGVKVQMDDVTYTACEACKTDPDKPPVWLIKASDVTHDKEEQRISYKNARFELFGVPMAYVPYFSHADGSVERESGFLSPSAGFKSDFGAFLETRYYWDIAPDQDATLGVIAYTEETPLLHGQWRKRWADASLTLEGGITDSSRTDSESGVDLKQDEEVRGHVLAEGLWNINQLWRAGADVEWASDDQYMRQYDFVDENVLTSDIYAERFEGRNYAAGHLLSFQDVRVREEQVDQPDILPELFARFEGDPNGVPVIGGSWFAEGSFLGLRREGDGEALGVGQDMDRISVGGGWQRRLLSDTGLLTNIRLSARQDIYNIRDLDSATSGSGLRTEANETRFFPQAHFVSSYPVARDFETMQAVIEPIVSATIAPNIDVADKIPNEDSQDVQLDALNLFNPNRFPGLDRAEDLSRVTYGLRAGLYHDTLGQLRTFLGQSYRLQEDDNPFPEGSGLNRQSSDVVGEVNLLYGNRYQFDYRFQMDSRNLSSRRQEIDATADFGRLDLGGRYLFAKALEGTDIDESREQLQANAGYYWTQNWRSRLGFTQDLGDAPGLRQAYIGLEYYGQCLFLSLTGQRNLTDDSSGESDTEVLFRIGLKNLGEFQRSKWHTPP